MPEHKTDRKSISVEIQLTGDQWADSDELDLRWLLEDEVEERGIGEVTGGGSGRGWMDFAFEVANEDAVGPAIEAIKGLLAENNVTAEARIRVFDINEPICDETPDFQPGDCLSFRFKDGNYGALLVLACGDEATSTPDVTLVGALDYKRPEPPDMAVFEARQWLIGAHPSWRGQPYLVWLQCFVGVEVQAIGRSALRGDDPGESRSYLRWDLIGQYLLKQKYRDVDGG